VGEFKEYLSLITGLGTEKAFALLARPAAFVAVAGVFDNAGCWRSAALFWFL